LEYDLEKPETWIVYPEPPTDPGFDRELLAIGDRNPHGAPMLVRRWGATYRSKGQLVYKIYEGEPIKAGYHYKDPDTGETVRVEFEKEAPRNAIVLPYWESLELGELRHIIERWVSPDDLAKQGYFDPALRAATLEEGVSPALKGEAGRELRAMVKAGEPVGRAIAKVESQLDRARASASGIVELDQDTMTYFDPAWRTRGDYQFFFRLERPNGTYHPADGEALEAIRMIWKYNQTVSPAEHEANIQAAYDRGDLLRDERVDALWSPDNITQYRDTDGLHTLWQDRDGTANARIDTVI
jgi:hypothetical protein